MNFPETLDSIEFMVIHNKHHLSIAEEELAAHR